MQSPQLIAGFFVVGKAGFEPATSRTPSVRANLAAPLPETIDRTFKIFQGLIRSSLQALFGKGIVN